MADDKKIRGAADRTKVNGDGATSWRPMWQWESAARIAGAGK